MESSPDEYRLIDSTDVHRVLEQQLEIYQTLLRQGQMLLRLVIATFGVLIAIISALVTGVLNSPFQIKPVEFYVRQATSSTAGVSDTEGALVGFLLLISGTIVFVTGTIVAISGLVSTYDATSRNSFEPYLSGRELQFTTTESGVNDVIESYVNYNALVLYQMKTDLNDGYRFLSAAAVLLLFGVLLSSSGYFVRIDLAFQLSIIVTAVLPLILTFVLLRKSFGDLSSKSIERIDSVGNRMDTLATPVAIILVGAFVWSLLSLILYLLRGGLFVGVVVLVAVILPILLFAVDRIGRGDASKE